MSLNGNCAQAGTAARATGNGLGTAEVVPAVEDSPTPIPILSREQVLEQLHTHHRHANTDLFRAMYSSVVGGITTDPAAMVVPLDDHMVHRGHAVFDTGIISRGHVYELDEHVDRLLRSAGAAKIPPHFSRATLRSIILSTAAASGLVDGELRYWLSAGPGGFGISAQQCTQPSFYVIAIACDPSRKDDRGAGIRVITTSVPMKSPQMSTMKTVNYLPNVLVHREAEERGADEAIWIDELGNVAEGPTMNVAFVSADDVLLVPSFERILAGCTVQRVMKLAQPLMRAHAGPTGLLADIRCGPVREAEARAAKEMMLIGSGSCVKPVVEWDGKPVGTGVPGPVAEALHDRLKEDYLRGPLVPIPF